MQTEATKVIMTYLARVTLLDQSNAALHNPKLKDAAIVGDLENKVLDTNPLLEAFGNAKTLKNDNSSRFGKFIKIEMNQFGRIVGATIEKYLLEKTRIIHQIEGERSYHIFYQLLRGASKKLLDELGLDDNVGKYSILMSRTNVIPTLDDAAEFKTTCHCMKSVGIDENVQNSLYGLLAAILHLGNVHFEDDDAEGQVGNVTQDTLNHFQYAAKALGVDVSCKICEKSEYV